MYYLEYYVVCVSKIFSIKKFIKKCRNFYIINKSIFFKNITILPFKVSVYHVFSIGIRNPYI